MRLRVRTKRKKKKKKKKKKSIRTVVIIVPATKIMLKKKMKISAGKEGSGERDAVRPGRSKSTNDFERKEREQFSSVDIPILWQKQGQGFVRARGFQQKS